MTAKYQPFLPSFSEQDVMRTERAGVRRNGLEMLDRIQNAGVIYGY